MGWLIPSPIRMLLKSSAVGGMYLTNQFMYKNILETVDVTNCLADCSM